MGVDERRKANGPASGEREGMGKKEKNRAFKRFTTS
jgi:hypothetical protein